jgi:hypothetical protein
MKDIKGYEGLYAVTTDGRIWSYPKLVGGGHRGKWLRPLLLKNGYFQVSFRVKSSRKTILLHRAVAEAFIPNPLNKRCVNHKNGWKLDNQVENLEWVTYKENMAHAMKNNLNAYGENNGNSKLSRDLVSKIREIKNKTYTDIGKMFGVSRVQISNIINQRQWQK